MQRWNHRTALLGIVIFMWSIFPSTFSIYAQEGDRIAEQFLNNVVQLTVTFSDGSTEYGFGFVVGEREERFYIATANHVVRTDAPDVVTEQVLVRFHADRGNAYTANLLDVSYRNLDLALLEIASPFPNFTWTTCCLYPLPTRGDRVWFIGRNQDWWVPTDNIAGVIRDAPLMGELPVSISGVQPGTSGAPLIAEQGIVGMIIEDMEGDAIALEIETIRQVVAKRWGYPWGIEEFEAQDVVIATPTPVPVASSASGSHPTIPFRSEPMLISLEDSGEEFNLDTNWRPHDYMQNNFEDLESVLVDHATGLMWHKFGSEKDVIYEDAVAYINDLNREQFAGYADWRLPTIPELMSLLEPEQQSEGWHLDARFGNLPNAWSADKQSATSLWYADFGDHGIYIAELQDELHSIAVRNVMQREISSTRLSD